MTARAGRQKRAHAGSFKNGGKEAAGSGHASCNFGPRELERFDPHVKNVALLRWRLARWGAVALVLAVLAYPVLVNAGLALGAVPLAFRGTDTVKVDFRRAWSFWPGRVHVEGLLVTMQDRNVQFALRIAEADVQIRLRELLSHTFHATWVRANGISFRFRHRLQPEDADAPYVAAYPPIPGFSDPPLRESGPPTPPLDDAHYNLWTVHIDDVDGRVDEMWAQMFRYQGDGRVRGSFRLQPARRLWVGPATLELLGGLLQAGPVEVAREFSGTVDCTVFDFDVQPVHGMDVFRFISARAKLHGQVPNLDLLSFLDALPRGVRVEDGSGALDTDVGLDHGSITSDSAATYRTRHLTVHTPKWTSHLDGEMAFGARGLPATSGGEASFDVARASLQFDGNHHRAPELIGAHVAIRSTTLDTTRAFHFAGLLARLERGAVSDLRWLNELPMRLPDKLAVRGGTAHAHGEMSLSPADELRGAIAVSLDRAQVERGNGRLLATADGSAEFETRLLGEGRSPRGTLKLRAVATTVEGRTDEGSFELANAGVSGALRRDPQGTFGQFRAEAKRASGEAGEGRISIGALRGSVLISPATTFANAQLTDVSLGDGRATRDADCPWAKLRSAAFQGTWSSPANELPSAKMSGTLDGLSLTWGQFATDVERVTLGSRWEQTLAHQAMGRIATHVDLTGLAMQNAAGPPKSWNARVEKTSVDAELAMSAAGLGGPVRFQLHSLAGQVGKMRVTADAAGTFAVRSRGESLRMGDVAGGLLLDHVTINTPTHRVENWWAKLSVPQVLLDTRQDFNVSGEIAADFRDGLPALYALASDEVIPGWTPSLLPLHDLRLHLAVNRFCRMTDVHIIDAQGGPLAARGRLQVEPGETRAALLFRLVSLPFVTLGLNVVEDYSSTALLVGGGWLDKRTSPLDISLSERRGEVCVPQPTKCR